MNCKRVVHNKYVNLLSYVTKIMCTLWVIVRTAHSTGLNCMDEPLVCLIFHTVSTGMHFFSLGNSWFRPVVCWSGRVYWI